jgi:hypothetical protein
MQINNGVLDLKFVNVFKIVQVGCGGTGGYVQYFLSRLLYSLNYKPGYVLCDGDVVERKNLLRQNFIEGDLGENKAYKLAFRYGSVYGLKIEYVDSYIEDAEMLLKLLPDDHNNISLLLGCVDNNKSRQVFHEVFETMENIIYIDSGNDETTGQVVCGVKYKGKVLLPPLGEVYPDVLEDTDSIFKSEESCEDNIVKEPQDIATNILAGQIVFGYVNNLITRKKLKVHMTTFSSETATARSRFIEGKG